MVNDEDKFIFKSKQIILAWGFSASGSGQHELLKKKELQRFQLSQLKIRAGDRKKGERIPFPKLPGEPGRRQAAEGRRSVFERTELTGFRRK